MVHIHRLHTETKQQHNLRQFYDLIKKRIERERERGGGEHGKRRPFDRLYKCIVSKSDAINTFWMKRI